MATVNATYSKLNSGDWGVEVYERDVDEGDVVYVQKEEGIGYETIKKVLYRTKNFALCTIQNPESCGNFSEIAYRESRDDQRQANPIRWKEEHAMYAHEESFSGRDIKSFEEWR